MNFEQLKTKRNKEIKQGKNLGTRSPIYTVIDLDEKICYGHSDYDLRCNLKGVNAENGYIDFNLDSDDIEFMTSPEKMVLPEEVTRFYIDRYVAFFLTSEEAHNYLIRQKHNLSDRAYVFVHGEGYSNNQISDLFK